MSTPTLPDIAALADFGGAMTNGAPVENPTTDRDASLANLERASTAAMTRTVWRFWVRFHWDAVNSALVLDSHDSNWGNGAPVAPTLIRLSQGVFTVTVPPTVTDELGNPHSVSFRGATASQETGSTPRFVQASVSSNVVLLAIYDNTNALSDPAGVIFVTAV